MRTKAVLLNASDQGKRLLVTAATMSMVLGTGLSLAQAPATQPACPSASRPAWPSRDEIRQVVRQLNHPSPARRQAAIRKLATWGPLAFGELRQAAEGPNLESALAARDLLKELESAIFIGARVRLEVDHPRITWDQPITLTVYAHNPGPGSILASWPAPPCRPSSQPFDGDARQVGAFLDAADFLFVTGPDGTLVNMRVDPIERDPAVRRAVDVRAGDKPPSQVVPAGQTARLDIPRFNRGWARFPMLAAGTYTITFAYQPRWQEPAWRKQGFGLLVAEPVTVEVVQAAPRIVREAPRPFRLQIARQQDLLVTELQNTWDRDQWINLNIGDATMARIKRTHATLEWCPSPSGKGDFEPFVLESDRSASAFQVERIKRLAPAETITLSRTPVAAIRQNLQEATPAQPSAAGLVIRYSFFQTAEALRSTLFTLGQTAKIPKPLFTGSITSELIRLDAP